MTTRMDKLLIISGPTASGKTSLGFVLAKRYNGEIISADSRQVYRGMDVVTGKEKDEDIKTWLIDVVDPNEEFHVSAYYELAIATIKDIWKMKKMPILVGGTGFYIKAILDGVGTMGIPPDWNLRQELETLSVDELGQKLKQLDPDRWNRMNESDRKNPRRLIRAIEIALHSHPELVSGSNKMLKLIQHDKEMDILWIGLMADFPTLYERIDKRVDERVEIGAVEETKKIAEKYGWEIPSMIGLGYRELRGHIEGKISLAEAVKRWKFAEHEYARKQMTWFRKEQRISWFDIADKKITQKVAEKVQAWYIG